MIIFLADQTPNRTPHTDARQASQPALPPAARAGERGR